VKQDSSNSDVLFGSYCVYNKKTEEEGLTFEEITQHPHFKTLLPADEAEFVKSQRFFAQYIWPSDDEDDKIVDLDDTVEVKQPDAKSSTTQQLKPIQPTKKPMQPAKNAAATKSTSLSSQKKSTAGTSVPSADSHSSVDIHTPPKGDSGNTGCCVLL